MDCCEYSFEIYICTLSIILLFPLMFLSFKLSKIIFGKVLVQTSHGVNAESNGNGTKHVEALTEHSS